jgi:hypothetical protein
MFKKTLDVRIFCRIFLNAFKNKEAFVNTFPYLAVVYGLYAVVSVILTIFLARTLFENGSTFLEGVFDGNPKMAEAVNRLLVVGFYLLNLGYACLLLQSRKEATTAIEGIEVLAHKLGFLLLSLGVMHFANLFLFYKIRRRSQLKTLPPPIAPQMRLPQVEAEA